MRHATSGRIAILLVSATALLAGCGTASRQPAPSTEREAPIPHESPIPRELRREARPIGKGARFHPALRNVPVSDCRRKLGPRIEVHVELFAKNRVVLLPAGIGTRPPRELSAGRVSQARCYGRVVTLEPTGVVLMRRGASLHLGDLFHAWGEPLSARRIASFSAPAGTRVSAYVDGRRWRGAAESIPLTRHAEIVVEVGPHVPPHRSFTFPPGP